MAHVQASAVLGVHEVDIGRSGGPWFDGIDLLLETYDDDTVVCGLRTADYVIAHQGVEEPEWHEGYRPLPTTIDLSTVRFWDFGELLWVGPADRLCLVWTNSEFSLLGIRTTFDEAMPGNILRGPDRRGLPSPQEVGIGATADLHWHRIN